MNENILGAGLETLRAIFIAAIICTYIALFFACLVSLLGKGRLFKVFFHYLAYSTPIGIIGFSAGLLTGLGTTSSVGNVIPTILTAIGGLGTYFFGVGAAYRFVIAYCIVILILMLFFGMTLGSRLQFQRTEERIQNSVYIEFRLRNLRENLGLPEQIPDWVASSGKVKD
jgi:hypothetical protein